MKIKIISSKGAIYNGTEGRWYGLGDVVEFDTKDGERFIASHPDWYEIALDKPKEARHGSEL